MNKVVVHEHGTTVVLACGLTVEARPQPDPEYLSQARELGYGDDILQMCKDHDPLHVKLCEAFGVVSLCLQQAAGASLTPRGEEQAAAEEAAVLAVQKWLRLT